MTISKQTRTVKKIFWFALFFRWFFLIALCFLLFYFSDSASGFVTSTKPFSLLQRDKEDEQAAINRFFETFDEALGPEIAKLNLPPIGEISIPYFFALQELISIGNVPVGVAIGVGVTYRIANHPVQRILRYHAGWRAPLFRLKEESLVAEAVAWYIQCANKLIKWRWGTPLDIFDQNFTKLIERIDYHFLVSEQLIGAREGDDEKPTLIIDYYETPGEKMIQISCAIEFAPTGLIDRLQQKGEHFLARGALTKTMDHDRLGARIAKAAFRMLIEMYYNDFRKDKTEGNQVKIFNIYGFLFHFLGLDSPVFLTIITPV